MNDSLFVVVMAGAVVYGTPVVWAGLGNILSERSGVLTLGTEGMMLLGAVAAAHAAASLDAAAPLTLCVAVLAGAAAGCLGALVHAVLSVGLRVNQMLSGLALTLLAGGAGLSSYLAGVWGLGERSVPHRFEPIDFGRLSDAPIVGPVVFRQTAMTYLSWLAVVVCSVYLLRTRRGLQVRAVGEAPEAAAAAGLNVVRIKVAHVLVGGAFAGVGGACLTLWIVPRWSDGLTGGQGWIAVALVVFARWRPGLLLVGAYLFGAASSLRFEVQGRWEIPTALLDMLPYLVTIVALVAMSAGGARRRLGAPASLGRPFLRGERTAA